MLRTHLSSPVRCSGLVLTQLRHFWLRRLSAPCVSLSATDSVSRQMLLT